MQKTPLVSVVIAFLNEEKFLPEAVKSVLAQTYTNWELLLVDDGSTNKSTNIAKQFAADHPGKIHYLDHANHGNLGVSASRNAGIQSAKGELVALLDADDVWLPEKLSKQVNIFQQHPEIALVAEASEYWYNWEDPCKNNVITPIGAPEDKLYFPAELTHFLYPLSTGAAPCPSGLMLTKAALSRAGGFEESFRGKFQLYEDQALLHKIYLKERVYISSCCNNLYRQRTGSIVQWVHADGHYHTVRRHFLEHLQQYMQRENITDKTTRRLLKKALVPYHNPRLYFFTETLPKKIKQFFNKVLKKLMLPQWQSSPY